MLNDESYIGRIRKSVGHDLLLVPGACVVLEDDRQRVLLQQRGDNHLWGLPGGSAEQGQNFKAIAVDEVREETGLQVMTDDLVGFASFSDPQLNTLHYPNGDVTHYFTLCFWVRRWQGSLVADGLETLRLEFFDVDRLPEECMPAAKKVLSFLAAYKNTGDFHVG
ncbi:MAG: hypothetical protein COB04_04655 [Gammaproteobacteria bacterium]|nr:MAG: hypothetical protein COB04_04655 [Gammaproteobacteria bacterium]